MHDLRIQRVLGKLIVHQCRLLFLGCAADQNAGRSNREKRGGRKNFLKKQQRDGAGERGDDRRSRTDGLRALQAPEAL